MIKINKKVLIVFLLGLIANLNVNSQEKIIDRVVAVVATSPIMQSEIETQYQQLLSDQTPVNENSRCEILEELLYQKLLVARAMKDSLEVSNDQVEQELEKRLRYYIQQFGSEERFVAFYGKSTEDWKTELKDNVRDILLAQQMQSKVVGDNSITPNEVRSFYSTIPEDSIPFINSEVEVGQIVKQPKVSAEAKKEAKIFIDGIRERIMKGEISFAAAAALYSKDPGSANKGGLYEKTPRGMMVPEWDSRAFKLKPNETSEVFETVYGYFIIQLVERRGDEADVRSLLYFSDVKTSDLLNSKLSLDSIYTKLQADSTTFSELASKYSDDAESKNSGGLIVNPYTGSTRFEMSEIGQMDQNIAFAIDKIKVGEYTKPIPFTTKDGKQAYRILYLKTLTAPHKANLKEDYQRIQGAALAQKEKILIKEWVKKNVVNTYVRITDDYKNCNFNNKWIN